MNNVGLYYEAGVHVKKDLALAVSWYKKSAEAGGAYGMEYLAGCYKEGIGVDKDLAKAIEWYTKAAEQGNEEAKTKLAELQPQNHDE